MRSKLESGLCVFGQSKIWLKASWLWRYFCQQLTQPSEEMIPGPLTELDDVSLCFLFSISWFVSLHFSTGQLIPRDQCVIGWGMPCYIECAHSGSDFHLSRGKNYWKRLEFEKKCDQQVYLMLQITRQCDLHFDPSFLNMSKSTQFCY